MVNNVFSKYNVEVTETGFISCYHATIHNANDEPMFISIMFSVLFKDVAIKDL